MQSLEKQANTVTLQTRESIKLGLYTRVSKIYESNFRTLMKDRSPKEYARTHPMETITYPVACNFMCDSLNYTEAYRLQCNSFAAGQRSICDSRVANCTGCMTLRIDSGKQDKCNACFHDEAFSYSLVGIGACLSGWRKEPTKTKQGRRGTELGVIMLEIPQQNTYVNAFYTEQPREVESVPGSINILKTSVIQDQ